MYVIKITGREGHELNSFFLCTFTQSAIMQTDEAPDVPIKSSYVYSLFE